ncbi:DUF4221 domain-containing protein [Bacteroidales bacterium OttesenSCG-928-I21]|nr:DUF4221 domain-containing protein [Bacteroidales bacterium OttesenSCG-928-I21]
MKKSILIFFMLATFFACNNREKSIEVIKSVEFKTGFVDVFFRFLGYFYDESSKQELVYFVEPDEIIKIFDINGKIINCIPLKKIIKEIGSRVEGISSYSKDTIFLLSMHHNKISVLNDSGTIVKSLIVDDILPDSAKNMFEFYQFLPYQLNNKFEMIFWAYPDYSNIMNKLKKDNLPMLEQDIFYFSYFFEQPRLLIIKDFFSDSINAEFILYDYYKKHYKADEAGMLSEAFFKQINDFIFVLSGSSNNIYVIDGETYKELREIEVISKHTNIGFESVFSKDYRKNAIRLRDMMCYSGDISNVFYNSKTKQYYVLVLHALKNLEEWQYLHDGDYRPFSIIIYNKNFENPKEYAFAANTYICRNSFMSEEGLWIQRKPENLTRENYGTQTFDLIKFN